MTTPGFPDLAQFFAREVVTQEHMNELRAALLYLKGRATGDDVGTLLEAPLRFVNVTTAQRDLLQAASGFTIYNTDNGRVETWNGAAWVSTAGGEASAIDAIATNLELVGGGSSGTVTIGAGPEITRRSYFGPGRYFYPSLTPLASLARGTFAIVNSAGSDVPQANWGASGLRLVLGPALPLGRTSDSRLRAALPLADYLKPGLSLRLLADFDNQVAMTIASAPAERSDGGLEILMGSSVVTGSLARITQFELDIGTREVAEVEAERVQNPGDLVAPGGAPDSFVVRDGSTLREVSLAQVQAVLSSGVVFDAAVGWSADKAATADELTAEGPSGGITIPATDAAAYLVVWSETPLERILIGSSPFNELPTFSAPAPLVFKGTAGRVYVSRNKRIPALAGRVVRVFA